MQRPGNPQPGPLQGHWSLPFSMTEIASRLGNMDPRAAMLLLTPTGLLRVSRKLWRVRLDTLDYGLRYRIEHGRSPPQ